MKLLLALLLVVGVYGCQKDVYMGKPKDCVTDGDLSIVLDPKELEITPAQELVLVVYSKGWMEGSIFTMKSLQNRLPAEEYENELKNRKQELLNTMREIIEPQERGEE